MGGDLQIMTTPEVYSAPPQDITSGKHITLSGERKLGYISNCFDVKTDLKKRLAILYLKCVKVGDLLMCLLNEA